MNSFDDDVTVSGGTADSGYQFDRIQYVEAFGYMDMAERSHWINENRMILFERLGAVLDYGGWAVRYWSIGTGGKLILQFFCRKPIMILAGFMGHARGRHWDRRSRKGIK